MADLIHNYIANPSLPYISNASPTETRPHWVSGSNCLINLKSQVVRRPGFEAYTDDTITGTVERIFTWSRWGAGYYVMLSVRDGSEVKVYKQLVGTDLTFQLLSVATSTSLYPYDFDISNNFLFMANGVDMWKYDGTTVTKWGIAKPAAVPVATPSAGALSPTTGYKYRYAFGTATHIGAISDESLTTGPQTSKQFTITGSNTSDTQVTKVYIFRTVNGGSIYLQHPSSPITYTAGWSFVDNTADTLLTNVRAPELNQNLPPVASRGTIFFANRLWTFAGDVLYYSNFEEQLMGREEESFDLINKYRFGREITALAVVQKSLLIYTRSTIFRILGDSLLTFQRAPFLTRFGVSDRRNVSQNARIVAWLDISGTSWYTDGNSLQEMTIPVRPDIEGITQTASSISFHNANNVRWMIIQDSIQDTMWVFDQDIGVWNVPWSIGGTAIHSGEISAGVVKLFIAHEGRILTLNTGLWTDLEVAYPAHVVLGLVNIVPSSAEIPRDGMSAWGALQYVGVETNAIEVYDVSFELDEDPDDALYLSIKANEVNPAHRSASLSLRERWYYSRKPAGRRVSVRLDWNAVDTEFKLYTLEIAGEIGNTPGEF